MARQIDCKTLDAIINEMIDVVENSKQEIFNISEEARKEYEYLSSELRETKEKVLHFIKKSDQLEKKVRLSRRRLSEVSKNFDRYSEEKIREVYEQTHNLQTNLAIIQQEEKVLRQRRDELERRLIVLNETIDRADALASKISVILPYLHDDFKQVNLMIEDAIEKQKFSLKIIEAQEEERRRISREIHDGPAQMLANILLRSEIVKKSFKEQSVDLAIREIESVRKMIRTSLHEVRRIIYDLRPMALDDLGLIPTIKKYVDNMAEYSKKKIEFIAIGQKKRLIQEYEVSLFRLIQESIQNAINHAEATSIKVKLEISDNYVTTIISDNGKGFDPNVIRDKQFGLIGMRERVEMLNGEFKIMTKIGEGTRIYAKVPCPKHTIKDNSRKILSNSNK